MGFSSCGMWASVAVAYGLSSCGSRALERRLNGCGLVAPRHVGSSRARDQTCVPCIGRQILNHCTTREVPLLPIFDWVVWFFDIELYKLFIYFGYCHLSVISFVNIFSHSIGCLFILLMVSFAVQKHLSLIRSHFLRYRTLPPPLKSLLCPLQLVSLPRGNY